MRLRRIAAVALAVPVAATVAWASDTPDPLPPGTRATRIVVEKHAHRLTLFAGSRTLRTYRVSLGRAPIGPKQRRGDLRTPEGLYRIDGRNLNSAYHRALHVSYPNTTDRARAAAHGWDPGGDIMVHGLRNDLRWLGPAHRLVDWTLGCIAVTDVEIDELARVVPDGTPIEIRP